MPNATFIFSLFRPNITLIIYFTTLVPQRLKKRFRNSIHLPKILFGRIFCLSINSCFSKKWVIYDKLPTAAKSGLQQRVNCGNKMILRCYEWNATSLSLSDLFFFRLANSSFTEPFTSSWSLLSFFPHACWLWFWERARNPNAKYLYTLHIITHYLARGVAQHAHLRKCWS